MEEGGGGGDGPLEILGEAPVSVDPGEEAFDDPAARENGEADLIGQLADDFDDDPRGVGDALAGIGGVGEDAFDERERAARGLKQRHGAVAILHRGRTDLQYERPAVGIDQRVTLAAFDLLAGVDSRADRRFPWSSPIGCRSRPPKGWPRGRRARDPASPGDGSGSPTSRRRESERTSDRSSDAAGSVRAATARGSRCAARRRSRSTFRASARPKRRPVLGGRRQQRREDLPLLVAQIAAIAQMVAVMPRSGLGRPHRRFPGERKFPYRFHRFAEIQDPIWSFETAS